MNAPIRRRFQTFGGGPRDSQRQKLYNWERATLRPFDLTRWTFNECRAVISWICADHHIETPIVGLGHGYRFAKAYAAWKIELPGWARVQSVVIHEASHILATHYCADQKIEEAGHGPIFVHIFIECMVRYGVRTGGEPWTVPELIRSARAAGLKVHRSAVLPELAKPPRRKADVVAPMKAAASEPGLEQLRRMFRPE